MPSGIYIRKTGRTNIVCKFCGNKKSIQTYLTKGRTGQKYCSISCYWKDKKGKDPKHLPDLKGKPSWNSGLTKETDERIKRYADSLLGIKHPNNKGENHFAWKGDKAGYIPKHLWVKREFGKANHCEICGHGKGRFEWSNKNHQYKRIKEDWQQLCTSCHKKYDYQFLNNQHYASNPMVG